MTNLKKKRNLILVLAAAVVIVAIGFLGRGLVEPAGAHPGYSCNPSAGHGNPGCHRSTTPTTKKVTTTTKKVTTTTKRATTTTKRATTTTKAPAANSTTTATATLGATTTLPGSTTSLEDSTTSVTDPTTSSVDPTTEDTGATDTGSTDGDTTDTTDLSELVAAIVAGGGGGGMSGGWIALLLVLAMLAAAGWALLAAKWAAGRRGRGGANGPVRFVLAERLGHWSYALFFLAAGVTGALMWIPWTAQRMAEAYFTVARYHGYVGLAMVIIPISISFILDRRRVAQNRRELTQWSRHDRRWLLAALAGGMFRGKRMPPQGRFNAGQKINSYLVAGLTVGFLVTGSMLIARGHLPEGLGSGVLLVHKVIAVTGVVLLLGHMSMALLTKHGRGGLRAMVKGVLPAHIAREGHLLWYAEWIRRRQEDFERSAADTAGPTEPAAPHPA
jgi:formate dehydrogenase subunit gamma